MDVRCEKCQTEYELDESRLRPGGVTVKCTHCGHLFKIHHGDDDHAGPPAVLAEPPPPLSKDVDSMLAPPTALPGAERVWLIRLENGEQKTCRELSALQEWISTGIAGRDAMISRTGKTWKRLGNIVELNPFFAVGDQAKARAAQPTAPPPTKSKTLRGVAGPPLEGEPASAEAASGDPATPPNPHAQTELSLEATQRAPASPTGQPLSAAASQWANGGIKGSESMAAMPQGPRSGRVALHDREPAFANRSRIEPGRLPPFDMDDEDDDLLPSARGSRAGMWIALLSLLAIAGAAAVYLLAFRGQEQITSPLASDAAPLSAVAPADAAATVNADAPTASVPESLASAQADLFTGHEIRMKTAYDGLAGNADGPSLAMRAQLGTALAQAALDRADLSVDRAETEKLRKSAKQLAIDSAALAERSRQMTSDDPNTNLAIADALRLQGKPASDVQRYLEAATSKSSTNEDITRSIALGQARLLMREGKLDDAQKVLSGKENTGDHRISLALALITYAQNKPDDAKSLVATVVQASPDHPVAVALQKRLATMVANTDPLPPEGEGSIKRPPGGSGDAKGAGSGRPSSSGAGESGDYDALVAKASSLAATNCAKAMDLYAKALDQKVTGVEALTGMGYCFLNGRQYASAFSKFRAALAVSSRYEPALAGVAETYQKQGNREQEIEAWRKYLDFFPNSAKAKKRLEALGAAAGSGTEGPGADSPGSGASGGGTTGAGAAGAGTTGGGAAGTESTESGTIEELPAPAP